MSFLDALIDSAPRNPVPYGCEPTDVEVTIRLSAGGIPISMQRHPEPTREVVPELPRSGGEAPANIQDNAGYVLGAWKKGSVLHERYRTLLAQIPHPAAKIIGQFLDRDLSTVVQTLVLPEPPPPQAGEKKKKRKKGDPISVKPEDRVIIEVEGYEKWWLTPEVLAFHHQRLAEKYSEPTPSGEVCSICATEQTTEVPFARLFPPSTHLKAGLISFSSPYWCAYGRKEGANTPTCLNCAVNIKQGLDAILSSRGTCQFYGPSDAKTEHYMLWWSSDPDAAQPWDLLEALYPRAEVGEDGKKKQPEAPDIERILAQFTDGYFALLERDMGRIALRRFQTVSAAPLRQRIRAWVETCRISPWRMVQAVGHSPYEDDPADIPAYDEVYLALIMGDILSPCRLFDWSDNIALTLTPTNITSRRVDFLTWMSRFHPTNKEINMAKKKLTDEDFGYDLAPNTFQPRQQCAFYLGWAFNMVTYSYYRDNPKAPGLDRLYVHAAAHPATLLSVLHTYGTPSPRLSDVIGRADMAVGGLYPDRFTPAEQTVLWVGFRASRRAGIREWTANGEIDETETDENDENDENETETPNYSK